MALPHRALRRFAVALGLVLFATATTSADVVILKDGFALHGKATREMSMLVDDLTGQPLMTAKVGGLHLVDDGPRFMIYSATTRRVGDVDNQIDMRKEMLRFGRKAIRGTTELPKNCKFSAMSDFDKDWKRTFRATIDRGYTDITQQIAGMTPYYAFLTASHNFTSWYLTAELGQDLVEQLLKTHPDLIEPPGQPIIERRLKLLEFFLQAKWYERADAMLVQWTKDFEKDQNALKLLDDAKIRLRNLRAVALVEEVEVARLAGRHRWAQEALKSFPNEGLEVRVLNDVAKLRATYEESVARFDAARRHLKELSEQIKNADERFLAVAAASILGELHFDNMDRIETFLAQAEQAVLDVKKGRKPTLSPGEILSLAVTGWLQGKNSAETKVASALRLWKAREMVLKLMSTEGGLRRADLLSAYLKETYALQFDEMAQMLAYLPPVEAETTTETNKILNRKTPGFNGHPNGVEYQLYLPPEYQHGRPYPVILGVYDPKEKPELMMTRLRPYAERHGYILAVPKWTPALGGVYGYTVEEQTAVTGTLKHVKRLVQVDSDRVFMIGSGEGARCAFDIGVSTPDLFAGVVPIGPPPSWTGLMLEYWRNTQILPYYVVMGNMSGPEWQSMRRVLEQWMPKGYPALTVLYKGRGMEWFGAELPNIFDWLNRKKRAEPWRELGAVGHEYRSARESDNRFYWLSTNELDEKLVKRAPLSPARLNAKILEGNQIHVTTFGVKQVTVWISRQMVDFERPITVTLNGKYKWTNGGKAVKPDISTMLEDFYDRNDRQRLFFYKVEFPNVR